MMKKNLRSFSLAELLLSMGLFAILFSAVGIFANEALRSSKNSTTRIDAAQYVQEMQNAIILNKDSLWSRIVSNTATGDKHVVFNSNTYTIADGDVTLNGIVLKVEIEPVNRDTNGDIVTIGGTVDLHSRAIISRASWVDFIGMTNTLTSTFYVSDWNTIRFTDTRNTDFSQGIQDLTQVTTTGDGEVTMDTVQFADWCKPSLTITSHDLPGQGIAKSLYVEPGKIYMGTGSNSSGVSFARLQFNPIEPPTVSTIGIFDGYKTNAVYSDGTYAYLATQTNSKEVVILNISTLPYTEIGYFNPSVSSRGYGIYVNGTVGFVATSNRIYAFNLTAKTGSRPVISYLTLRGTVVDMFARGNYAYFALSNSDTELEIVDLTNPSSMKSVGSIDLNNAAAKTVYVNTTGTRAYIGTGAQSYQAEFFIVDVSSKTGNKYPFSSYETSGMSPVDITAPDDSKRAIVVGTGGTLQYQVISLENENAPVRCGGLTLANGANAVFSMIETNGNAYSYIVTSDTSSELKVIKGGPGGGNGQGIGYNETAQFTSRVFDSTSTTSQYYTIEWQASVPANTLLRFQLRSGTTTNLSAESWIGPDGTSATFFTSSQASVIPSVLSGKRYIQYRAYFASSDQINTAVLNQLEMSYQK
jgi:type II secretory pathway pseudopilin PulG